MHQEAEYGIAAHVEYKDGEKGGERSSFDWIKSLIPGFRKTSKDDAAEIKKSDDVKPARRYGAQGGPEWLAELPADMQEPDLETTLKTDLFSRRVFVFTPTGDVVDLPADSSPIDFAYAIHSDIGDHVFAAKINNKLMPLDCILENGDIVEITTRKNAHPTRKWLDFAKTTMARRHIRLTLDKEKKS
jgi:guanosine-3',5'-bis(diphosphate) 3'-pyrophosphohydrolase